MAAVPLALAVARGPKTTESAPPVPTPMTEHVYSPALAAGQASAPDPMARSRSVLRAWPIWPQDMPCHLGEHCVLRCSTRSANTW